MDNFIAHVSEGISAAQVAAGAAIAWLATRFDWWKNSGSKLVKIGVPLALFTGVAVVVSLLA